MVEFGYTLKIELILAVVGVWKNNLSVYMTYHNIPNTLNIPFLQQLTVMNVLSLMAAGDLIVDASTQLISQAFASSQDKDPSCSIVKR